jgi:hypothetical protein
MSQSVGGDRRDRHGHSASDSGQTRSTPSPGSSRTGNRWGAATRKEQQFAECPLASEALTATCSLARDSGERLITP